MVMLRPQNGQLGTLCVHLDRFKYELPTVDCLLCACYTFTLLLLYNYGPVLYNYCGHTGILKLWFTRPEHACQLSLEVACLVVSYRDRKEISCISHCPMKHCHSAV